MLNYYTKVILLFLVIILASCEDNQIVNNTDLQDTVSNQLQRADAVHFNVNDFQSVLDKNGEIALGSYLPPNDERLNVIYSAGLWIAVNDGGSVKANVTWVGTAEASNFTADRNDSSIGVYYVPSNITNADEYHWPVEYGAPINNDGSIKTYGDLMCWQSLTSDNRVTERVFQNPIDGLRVNQAVYGYSENDLRNVFFVRYEITNLSDHVWPEVYVGFHSDTDFGDVLCNSTAYDSASSLTYTYIPVTEDGCLGGAPVTGFSFLETPNSLGVTTHRIMRKNNYVNPEFGEYELNTPEQVLFALQGLDSNGNPMINPVTGLVTNYAFTGDPITQTGWLDEAVDVRSLLTSGSFSLGVNETKVLTVVWISESESTMEESIIKLKDQLNQIRQEPQLWQF